MQRQKEIRRARLISFSGIDGAGKSTQIERLRANLARRGVNTRLVLFWEHAAAFTRFREGAGHAIFKGDRGVGTPSEPINRRDKNVRSWMMTCVRLLLYFADAVSLRVLIRNAQSAGAGALLFDRFIDDELANLPLGNRVARAYARAIASLAPKPDIRFFLDADPVLARARKPEYPLELLRFNRNSYLALSNLIGGFAVIAPGPVCKVEEDILALALPCFSTAPGLDADGLSASSTGREKELAKPDRSRAESAAT